MILTIVSCAEKKTDVPRISLSPTIINSELATNFPRELKVDGQYFYTPTMLNSGNVISIYDISTGDEIARTVRIGKGPGEFVTPQIVQICDGNIFIRDVNGKQQALFPLEQALAGNYECHWLSNSAVGTFTRAVMIDQQDRVFLQPEGKQMFQYLRNDSLTGFGDRFLEVTDKNSYTLMQGELDYHKKKKKLVYTNFFLPYISVYDFEDGAFTLSKERMDFDRPKDGQFNFDERRKGIGAMTLTKDYIVCIQRDYDKDPTDESTVGRDFSKLSQTLFFYDFNSRLVRIADLGDPVLRIASIQDNNDIIAVIFRDEKFQMVKYQL